MCSIVSTSMNKLTPLTRLAVFASLLLASCGEAPSADSARGTPKVLLIGIDGVRPDVLAEVATPHIDALVLEGWYTAEARTTTPSVSGPAWSSMLTGVWPDKHGVTNNNFTGRNYAQYPSFLARLEEVRPELATFAALDWLPLAELEGGDPVIPPAIDAREIVDGYDLGWGEADGEVTARAVQHLGAADPDALFVYLGNPDETSHRNGSIGAEYRDAIALADSHVGMLVDAIRARPAYADEDWLILISTDHGRRADGGHGGASPEEMTIFIVASGPATGTWHGQATSPATATQPAPRPPTFIVDVAATALDHLGIASDTAWQLDGMPLGGSPADRNLAMLDRIRAEGLNRSQLPNTLSYMTDVVGARLTNSAAMDRAQEWALGEMQRIGLDNTHREPFMNYGASWDNEYASVHMLEPDYQPLVAYPIAHTPGTGGKRTLDVVIADVRTRSDLEPLRGRLRGLAVMSTPPPVINLERFARGTPRRTDEEMRALEEPEPPPPPREPPPPTPADPPTPPDPPLNAAERLAFYVEEGVAVVLESNSGWPGAVRGFARPGAKVDMWDRDATLTSVPIIAVTPEHYNRMYRILERDIPVTVEAEVRNVHGAGASEARNVIGEIPGTDLAHEVVMLGAHFDTWHASPNASDNTSGAAVMLEAMRLLKAVGARPRRTIRIALWSGEEQGIFGSSAYVERHFGTPDSPDGTKPAYDDFSVYFNQDYGPGLYRGIWLQGNENARDLFAAWMEPLSDLGMTTISPRSVGSTDHVPFDRAGLPAFQFLQARVGGTGGHTNLDFYDTLPIDDLVRNAVIMATFVYNAAMADEKVPRK